MSSEKIEIGGIYVSTMPAFNVAFFFNIVAFSGLFSKFKSTFLFFAALLYAVIILKPGGHMETRSDNLIFFFCSCLQPETLLDDLGYHRIYLNKYIE
jgi:hypothetical protein